MSNGFTERLEDLLRRYDASKPEMFDNLIRLAERRLEGLTRRMLGREAFVHRWQQTGDVFQNATLRLHRALREVRPVSKKEFFSLAATLIRREILDMARQLRSEHHPAAHHQTTFSGGGEDSTPVRRWEGRAEDSPEQKLLFHEAVERLLGDELALVELIVYQGMELDQAAETLGVSERTGQRL